MYTEGSEGGTFCEVIETRVTPLKSWVNWRRNSPVFSDVPRLIDQQEVDERVVNTSGKKIGHLTLVRDSVCVVGEKAETSVDLRYSSPIVRNETWVALKHRRRLKTAKTINKLIMMRFKFELPIRGRTKWSRCIASQRKRTCAIHRRQHADKRRRWWDSHNREVN